VPIFFGDENQELTAACRTIQDRLRKAGISVKLDDRDTHKPGWKFAEYELKGVPVRLAIGSRDLQNGTIEVARRDTLTKESVPLDGLENHIRQLLDDIHRSVYAKALEFRTRNTRIADSYAEFQRLLDESPGFILAHWDGTGETEEKIKNETKATIRCIPLERDTTPGQCMVTGKPSEGRVLFARAY
jgi:prolyl-tRNA synthetase